MTGSRYVKAPQPNEEDRALYEAMLRVLSGESTVTEAAASVGLSRLRFQTRMNRGLTGLLEQLAAQPRGRPATPEQVKSLTSEVEQLRRENQRLSKQVESSARMMGIASEWMKKGLNSSRVRTTRASPEAAPANDSEEDAPARALAAVDAMRAQGVAQPLAATAIGVSPPTVRRWSMRRRTGAVLRNKRGPVPAPRPKPGTTPSAVALVERAHGCIGAAPLAKATGLSRRAAARVKKDVVTQLERTRRSDCMRVRTAPGVIRGFDPVMLGRLPVMVSADAAIPYRTLIAPAPAYGGNEVAWQVARDFEENGAPLVWRVDRAKAHTTPAVLAVLDAHRVLVMHGPPHCPSFYGQLERQNREHRQWLNLLQTASPGELAVRCEEMRHVFNELVPRRRLSWKTAAEVWRSSARPDVDRQQFAAEVDERCRKLKEALTERSYSGLCERLAIETALKERGL